MISMGKMAEDMAKVRVFDGVKVRLRRETLGWEELREVGAKNEETEGKTTRAKVEGAELT
jgi:hypothetical protein